jgi:hypothetical protein
LYAETAMVFVTLQKIALEMPPTAQPTYFLAQTFNAEESTISVMPLNSVLEAALIALLMLQFPIFPKHHVMMVLIALLQAIVLMDNVSVLTDCVPESVVMELWQQEKNVMMETLYLVIVALLPALLNQAPPSADPAVQDVTLQSIALESAILAP